MRTLLRIIGAWALGISLVFIALPDAVASDRTILVFGDSLSAALGLRPEQGWVALLAQRLQAQGYGYESSTPASAGKPPVAACSACREPSSCISPAS